MKGCGGSRGDISGDDLASSLTCGMIWSRNFCTASRQEYWALMFLQGVSLGSFYKIPGCSRVIFYKLLESLKLGFLRFLGSHSYSIEFLEFPLKF